MRFLLAFVVVAIICLGFMASQLAISSGNQLVEARQQIDALEQQRNELLHSLAAANSAAPHVPATSEAPTPQAATTTAVALLEGTSLQGSFTASTTDALQQLFPIGNVDQVQALTPDLVIVVTNREKPEDELIAPSSVWLVDLKKGQLTKMTEDEYTGYGNSFKLSAWQTGARIDVVTSPGEALVSFHSLYVNQAGRVVAESEAGDFNRDGSTLSLVLGSTKTNIRLVQTGECNGGGDLSLRVAPTSTLTGLVVNGRAQTFPHPFEAQCEPAYGASFVPVSMPPPTFDGKQFSFVLPGHSVSVSAAGVTVSQNTPDSYYITCATGYEQTEQGSHPPLMSVMHEDSTGDHVVVPNVWNDPALASVADGKTCFTPLEQNGGVVHFNLKTFELPSIGRVDYDIASKTFENLVVTTSTKTQ